MTDVLNPGCALYTASVNPQTARTGNGCVPVTHETMVR